MALFNQPSMIGPGVIQPNVKQESLSIDPATETVEGRVGNLLKTDSQGTYTNPLVRQSTDRQMQAFNRRGLLNSSMAMQAGQEAAISKAIDIAAPDAQMTFNNRRGNIDSQNTFAREQQAGALDMAKTEQAQGYQSQQGYQRALLDLTTNYQRQLDTINASQMKPEDKNIAVQQVQAQRDGEVAFQNNLYSRMPQWQQEWLVPAAAVGGTDVGSATNVDLLVNVINDPAQPQSVRDVAAARLQWLRSNANASAATPAAAGPYGVSPVYDGYTGGGIS